MADSASLPAPLPPWVLPERPDLIAGARGGALLLLPTACIFQGPDVFIPALVLSVGIGVGSALAWTILAGWRWLMTAPVSGILVIALHLGTAVNLWLVPRLDATVRAHELTQDASAWWVAGAPGDPPGYAVGDGGRVQWRREGEALVTPEPILRWTPFGWKPACWLRVGRSGAVTVSRIPPG